MTESNKYKIIQGKKIRRRSIRDKLLIGFLLLVINSAILGGFGLIQLGESANKFQTLYSENLISIQNAYSINQDLLEINDASQQAVLNIHDALALYSQKSIIKTKISDLDAKISNSNLGSGTAINDQIITALENDWAKYKTDALALIDVVDTGDIVQSKAKLQDINTNKKSLNADMTAIIDAENVSAKNAYEMNLKQFQVSKYVTFGLCFLIAIAGIAISFYFSNWIARTTKNFAKISTGLSTGDLNQHVVEKTNDEFGDLATSYVQMIRYFNNIKMIADKISENDLSVEITPLSENDALGNAFLVMATNLKKMIAEINNVGLNLGSASKLLAEASSQNGQASEQIAITTQQVADGITQQSDSMTRVVSAVEQMDRAVEGVAKGAQEQSVGISQVSSLTNKLNEAIIITIESAENQAVNSEKTLSVGKETVASVEKTIESMNVIQENVTQTAIKVTEMGSHSEQINSIVETIEDISSQTNLLALNAAIEAARAGEQGKGFAVVADEVRKLAEKSSVSAKEIAQLVYGIRTSINETSKAMQTSADTVASGVVMAKTSGDTAQQILKIAKEGQESMQKIIEATQIMKDTSSDLVDAMDTVSAVIEENTASTEEMSAGSSQISQMMENIASVSEENSAAIEQISASSTEMTSQIEQVAESAAEMAVLAEELEKLVNQFKLSVE
jgi:methyl-accepting chemotaxis protein